MAEAKELKEVLKATTKAGVFVAERLKDGPDVGDLFAIPAWAVKNSADIQAAVQGVDKLDDEIKLLADDADAREDLALFVLQELVPEIVASLKS